MFVYLVDLSGLTENLGFLPRLMCTKHNQQINDDAYNSVNKMFCAFKLKKAGSCLKKALKCSGLQKKNATSATT